MNIYLDLPRDSWSGEHVCLYIRFGSSVEIPLMQSATQRLSANLDIIRAYVSPNAETNTINKRFVINLPFHIFKRDKEVACKITVFRDNTEIEFVIPSGALPELYEIEDVEGIKNLYNWMAELGKDLYAHIPFVYAMIGVEVSAKPEERRFPIPPYEARGELGYLVPENGEIVYYPPNIDEDEEDDTE